MSLNRNASSSRNAFLWQFHLFSEYGADGRVTAVNTKFIRPRPQCFMALAGKLQSAEVLNSGWTARAPASTLPASRSGHVRAGC
jgi:hypothetical protein